MQKRVLSLLVDNTAGVTTRVSGLFSRRGYNIDSITGGVTADERFSRITVVCSGDELILEQITNQLAKLVDVRDIKILEPDNSVCHELMMIKVAAKPEQRQGLISIADVFHAKVADVTGSADNAEGDASSDSAEDGSYDDGSYDSGEYDDGSYDNSDGDSTDDGSYDTGDYDDSGY